MGKEKLPHSRKRGGLVEATYALATARTDASRSLSGAFVITSIYPVRGTGGAHYQSFYAPCRLIF
jgi:hypothetical protein